MNEEVEFMVRMVLVGVGATVVMDLWALVLRTLGIASLDFALLGRWVGHVPHGRFKHDKIALATPIAGERILGWTLHYLIGIGFSGLLLFSYGLTWARGPSLLPALLIGLLTAVAPLFILQPALGAGIASSKTPRPVFNSLKSVVTHLVYGFGLYLAAMLTSWVWPASL